MGGELSPDLLVCHRPQNVKYTGIDSKGKRPGFRSKTFKKRRGRMAVEDEAAMMSQRLRRELGSPCLHHLVLRKRADKSIGYRGRRGHI